MEQPSIIPSPPISSTISYPTRQVTTSAFTSISKKVFKVYYIELNSRFNDHPSEITYTSRLDLMNKFKRRGVNITTQDLLKIKHGDYIMVDPYVETKETHVLRSQETNTSTNVETIYHTMLIAKSKEQVERLFDDKVDLILKNAIPCNLTFCEEVD
jgi:hypothetical protein